MPKKFEAPKVVAAKPVITPVNPTLPLASAKKKR